MPDVPVGGITPTQQGEEELRQRVNAIHPWFHSISLPGGIITPGAAQLAALSAFADVYFAMGIEGQSVLDVGAWDGFYSFEAERRGASDVLAVDHFVWQRDGQGKRAAIDLCRQALGSKVRIRDLDLYDTTRENVGEFDVVIFGGIIYHIIDPVHALLQMHDIARRALIVETWIDNLDCQRAVMNFFPAETMSEGAPQNGWGPNSLLMHALLRRIGFETVLEWPTPFHEAQRSIFLAFKPGHCFGQFVARNQDRATPRFVGTPSREPELLATIEILTAARDEARAESNAIMAERDAARQECEALRRSISWRITRPLRLLRRSASL